MYIECTISQNILKEFLYRYQMMKLLNDYHTICTAGMVINSAEIMYTRRLLFCLKDYSRKILAGANPMSSKALCQLKNVTQNTGEF